MAYRQYLHAIDQASLIIAFKSGLEPTLRYAIDQGQPKTIEAAFEIAWTAHLGPTPPWKEYVDAAGTRIVGQVHEQLEQFSREAAQYVSAQQAEFLAQTGRGHGSDQATTPAVSAAFQPELPTFGPVLNYGPM